MDLWGPFLSERAWGTSLPRDDATYEAACASGKCRDGLFGISHSSGTLSVSFAFWNGKDSHLKERLFDEREMYYHGLAEPLYRYSSCRYIYPQTAFPYETPHATLPTDRAFELHFELAKEKPARLYYQLSARNLGPDAAELTVAALVWACHKECGQIAKDEHGNCLALNATGTCSSLSDQCVDLNQALCSMSALRYTLHYQPEGLQSVAFSDTGSGKELSQLIVHGDPHGAQCSDSTGRRAAVVYRLNIPAGDRVSLNFLLAKAQSPQPNWTIVPGLMQRAADLADEKLRAAVPDDASDEVKRISKLAYTRILWNRQLCETDAPETTCLIVVPDKWHRPVMGSWEHGFHAIVLCQVSRELAAAELRNQLARLSVNGAFAYTKPAPPIWPLALLEFLRHHEDKEESQRIFIDLLRHLNWWLLDRHDERERNTLEGGILSLEPQGWMDGRHTRDTNDSVVWSGFFCAKMIHLAVLMQTQELKSLIDLFSAALSAMQNDVAFIDDLFKPSCQGAKLDNTATCYCSFGFVPIFGCACIPWDLVSDKESRVLIEWLRWLSYEDISNETPTLFVKVDSNSNKFLLSWLTEADFVRVCSKLFDCKYFLSPHGIRCNSLSPGEHIGSQNCGCSCTSPGTISLPLNYLVLEALKCWESVYGQQLLLEYPTGSGVQLSLCEIIVDISQRIVNIFSKFDESDSKIFYEFYAADTGQGIGASHVSWSTLVANVAQNLKRPPTLALHVPPVMPRAVGRIMPRNSVMSALRRSLRSSSIKLEEFAPDATFDWSADD